MHFELLIHIEYQSVQFSFYILKSIKRARIGEVFSNWKYFMWIENGRDRMWDDRNTWGNNNKRHTHSHSFEVFSVFILFLSLSLFCCSRSFLPLYFSNEILFVSRMEEKKLFVDFYSIANEITFASTLSVPYIEFKCFALIWNCDSVQSATVYGVRVGVCSNMLSPIAFHTQVNKAFRFFGVSQ